MKTKNAPKPELNPDMIAANHRALRVRESEAVNPVQSNKGEMALAKPSRAGKAIVTKTTPKIINPQPMRLIKIPARFGVILLSCVGNKVPKALWVKQLPVR